MAAGELDRAMQYLAKLPGLGPRSARRAILHLMKRRDSLMIPLADALRVAAERIKPCAVCGNLDTTDPCAICADDRRDGTSLCVIQDVADIWALERASGFKGRYHVLGGVLSALDGIGPEDLNLDSLIVRAAAPEVTEVILAMNATVDGQTTAHYIADRLSNCGVRITRLAHGVPVGGELDYLDDGTLAQALRARQNV
ncbi:MAG: recombination mediator RecR [Alphaproteobacteria bacterium]|nr:recombination mediator RecR [Alphaproteobacteria bacterium]